nr:heparanase-like protein 1 [Ipomoea trifida]
MHFPAVLLLFLALFPTVLTQTVEHAALVIETTARISDTDANYICATLDWWPHDKCNYNQCPWGSSSVLNLDLSHPFLAKAIQAFEHLRLRLGGSLQDQVLYDVGNLKTPCHPFRKQKDGLFGFSNGCLPMDRWDKLNSFFKRTGLPWLRSSALSLGNELCGTGVGASVDAELYAKDMIRLKSLIDQLYKDVHPKPLLLAPGGFYDKGQPLSML